MSFVPLIHEPRGQRVERDEALAIARECPAAEWCTVAVRESAPCYV